MPEFIREGESPMLLAGIASLAAKALPFVSSLFTTTRPAAPTFAPSAIQRYAPPPVPMLPQEALRRALARKTYVARTYQGAVGRIAGAFGPGGRRRRRMRATNIKALRRAIRRVRSFQRVTRKVSRLFPRRHVMYAAPRRRRLRRGDIYSNPFYAEDAADVLDEMEDFGYDPFRDEEADEE